MTKCKCKCITVGHPSLASHPQRVLQNGTVLHQSMPRSFVLGSPRVISLHFDKRCQSYGAKPYPLCACVLQERSHLGVMCVTCGSSSATTWTDTSEFTVARNPTSVTAAIRWVTHLPTTTYPRHNLMHKHTHNLMQ